MNGSDSLTSIITQKYDMLLFNILARFVTENPEELDRYGGDGIFQAELSRRVALREARTKEMSFAICQDRLCITVLEEGIICAYCDFRNHDDRIVKEWFNISFSVDFDLNDFMLKSLNLYSGDRATLSS